ncbi:MAG: hypothetical protein KGJ13_08710 [Patescibacteria group bacterium]|nr:hypothetical protein [Patescibacteria group bacterium]
MSAVFKSIEAAKAFLLRTGRAYKTVFKTDDPAVETVLKDLAKFCRANRSCFAPDPRLHAVLEGRREVFLRIVEHLNLTPDQLFVKFGGVPTMEKDNE